VFEPLITPLPETAKFLVSATWKRDESVSYDKHPVLIFPQFVSTQKIEIDMSKIESNYEFSCEVIVNDQFILKSLTTPFVFCIDFPQVSSRKKHRHHHKSDGRKSSRSGSSVLRVQVDCSELFFKDVLRCSYECIIPGYAFSMRVDIDKPLINTYFLRRFAPSFLRFHIVSVIDQKPTFIKYQSNYYLMGADTILVFSPRVDINVNIEFFVGERIIHTCIGTGNYQISSKKSFKHLSLIGSCSFSLLPQRIRYISLNKIDSIETFGEATMESYDPAEPFGGPSEPLFDSEATIIMEPKDSLYSRWIVLCPNTRAGHGFQDELNDFVYSHHKKQHTESDTYYKAIQKNFDLITGFQLFTPSEVLCIIEARASIPKSINVQISKFLMNCDPSIRVLHDPDLKFSYPRLYCNFDELFFSFSVPLSLSDLAHIDGLYIRKSPTYYLYSIVQRLITLYESSSFNYALDTNSLPSYQEILLLNSKQNELYITPLSRYMVSSTPKKVQKNSKEVLFDSNEHSLIVKPIKVPMTTRLSYTMIQRTIKVDEKRPLTARSTHQIRLHRVKEPIIAEEGLKNPRKKSKNEKHV